MPAIGPRRGPDRWPRRSLTGTSSRTGFPDRRSRSTGMPWPPVASRSLVGDAPAVVGHDHATAGHQPDEPFGNRSLHDLQDATLNGRVLCDRNRFRLRRTGILFHPDSLILRRDHRSHPVDDRPERAGAGQGLGLVARFRCQVPAWERIAELAQDLDPLDRVDPQVGLDVEVQAQRLDRVAGPITDDLQQALGDRRSSGAPHRRDRPIPHDRCGSRFRSRSPVRFQRFSVLSRIERLRGHLKLGSFGQRRHRGQVGWLELGSFRQRRCGHGPVRRARIVAASGPGIPPFR